MMTSAGVFIGTTAVILLMSLGAGLQRSVLAGFNDVGDLTEMTVNSPGDIFFAGGGAVQSDVVLNEQAIDGFRDLPGVVAATPVLRLQASAELRLNRLTGFTSIQGVDTAEYRQFGVEMASGSDTPGQWQALVGARVADNFFNNRTGEQGGNDLNLQGQTLQLVLTRFSSETGETIERTVRLRVVGVMAESGGERDFSIYMPIRNVESLNSWASGQRANASRDGYSQAIVKVETADVATAVEQEITRQGFFVFSFQSVLSSINVIFLIIQIVVGSIGGLALIVAAFGIANTMIMSIYERTREIGLMKAVGATNRDVMLIFLAEAGTIGLIGGIGGVLFGVILGQIGGYVGQQFLLAQIAQTGGSPEGVDSLVYTPLWLPLFSLVFAALVGVLSGIYPALRAIRLDPIAALRYE
ncbi:MAG: ABC transporter permease, partial [Chloroflexi bacterium]|nr:ABC transporter permease [Chloroflexota bacterium]